ncbi:hypothetical protein [Streptomyces sp. G1]|uniref:hypothetical protein n=1 Tax=Streptomyces sp. G1 TaxID=361572 RepID=UPI00203050AF|nr:hypothetical protein [Streptomyces sp. G1]MCM1971411.1 hypothetical protein [Streptomyces sp. G1]
MRLLAVATAADLVLLTAGAAWHSPVTTVALLLASGLTVSTNGLYSTSVAEYAGPDRAGHTLGRTDGSANHGLKPTRGAVAGGRPRLDCPEGNSSPAGV